MVSNRRIDSIFFKSKIYSNFRYHRRFIEVAESYYIKGLNKDVFLNVIDFFNETWKNKPKPYRYNEYLNAKKKVGSGESLEEVRDTTMQPTVFYDKNGKIQYNSRKINEFPKFISKLKPQMAAGLACDHIYFNYNFFTGMYVLTETDIIFENLKKFESKSSYRG